MGIITTGCLQTKTPIKLGWESETKTKAQGRKTKPSENIQAVKVKIYCHLGFAPGAKASCAWASSPWGIYILPERCSPLGLFTGTSKLSKHNFQKINTTLTQVRMDAKDLLNSLMRKPKSQFMNLISAFFGLAFIIAVFHLCVFSLLLILYLKIQGNYIES